MCDQSKKSMIYMKHNFHLSNLDYYFLTIFIIESVTERNSSESFVQHILIESPSNTILPMGDEPFASG